MTWHLHFQVVSNKDRSLKHITVFAVFLKLFGMLIDNFKQNEHSELKHTQVENDQPYKYSNVHKVMCFISAF